MKQLVINKGKYRFLDVTEPALGAGEVLVQLAYSAVSRGTETQTLRNSKSSVVTRALQRPQKILSVLEETSSRGARTAFVRVV